MDTDTIYPWLFKTNAGTPEGVKKAWETRHAQGEVAKEDPESTRTPRPKQVDELFSSYDKLVAGIDVINKKIDELQRSDRGNPEKPKLAYRVVEHAKTLHAKYPAALKSLAGIRMSDVGMGNAYAAYTKQKEILVSNMFSHIYRDTFQKTLASDVQSGYHPVGCDTPEAMITHEFGHHVEQLTHDADVHKPVSQVGNPRVIMDDMWGGVKSSHPDIPDWTPENEIIMLMSDIENNPPSEYAKLNKSECWAESFMSVYHTPPDKQTPEIKRLAELMSTPYWKKIWEKPLQ